MFIDFGEEKKKKMMIIIVGGGWRQFWGRKCVYARLWRKRWNRASPGGPGRGSKKRKFREISRFAFITLDRPQRFVRYLRIGGPRTTRLLVCARDPDFAFFSKFSNISCFFQYFQLFPTFGSGGQVWVGLASLTRYVLYKHVMMLIKIICTEKIFYTYKNISFLKN